MSQPSGRSVDGDSYQLSRRTVAVNVNVEVDRDFYRGGQSKGDQDELSKPALMV